MRRLVGADINIFGADISIRVKMGLRDLCHVDDVLYCVGAALCGCCTVWVLYCTFVMPTPCDSCTVHWYLCRPPSARVSACARRVLPSRVLVKSKAGAVCSARARSSGSERCGGWGQGQGAARCYLPV